MPRKSRTCQSRLEMGCVRSKTNSMQENWNYEDLEESKEETAACIKSVITHKMSIDLALRKANENFAMAFAHTVADSTAGEENGEVSIKIEEKCKCQKDNTLPCCIKAKEWLMIVFDNKGTKFNHTKYKDQYLVIINNNIENIKFRYNRKERECTTNKERFK